MTAVYPLSPHCWHIPSPGGLEDFPFTCPAPLSSTLSLATSFETMGRRKIRRTPRWCRMTGISPLSLHCWHLKIPGGLVEFRLDNHPPPPSVGSPALSPERRGRRRSRRTPRPCRLDIFFFVLLVATTPTVIASAIMVMNVSRFSFGDASS